MSPNAATGPLVLMCHGWPELWYSWRHQLKALAEAGFRAVAPDMRGFGRTSAPDDVAAYTIFHNVGDMVALVAALGEKRALIVGHDWGAPVAWHAALMRPDIFPAVVRDERAAPQARPRGAARDAEAGRQGRLLLDLFPGAGRRGRVRARCARSRSRASSTSASATRRRDDKMSLYVDRAEGLPRSLARSRAAAAVADARPTSTCSPTEYQRTGFRGGLNWYRNIDRNWELTAPWHGAIDHAARAVHRRHARRGDHRLDGPARAR